MADTISTNKYVELTYRIIDKSNGEVIEQVEDPLGYVQGDNTLLFNQVTKELCNLLAFFDFIVISR